VPSDCFETSGVLTALHYSVNSYLFQPLRLSAPIIESREARSGVRARGWGLSERATDSGRWTTPGCCRSLVVRDTQDGVTLRTGPDFRRAGCRCPFETADPVVEVALAVRIDMTASRTVAAIINCVPHPQSPSTSNRSAADSKPSSACSRARRCSRSAIASGSGLASSSIRAHELWTFA